MLVYRLDRDRFLIVVNASNADKDWAWLNAVNNGEVLIDPQRPDLRILGLPICATCRTRPAARTCASTGAARPGVVADPAKFAATRPRRNLGCVAQPALIECDRRA